jgi:hypothetical protein
VWRNAPPNTPNVGSVYLPRSGCRWTGAFPWRLSPVRERSDGC